ncbi:helix-turn-helix domain-containing protein [Nocardioides sp. W3-2-3]|nr:helix-turn-helix domain-containing protein [Nocardioides convexus]
MADDLSADGARALADALRHVADLPLPGGDSAPRRAPGTGWVGIDHLLTPDEAAEFLRVSRWTLNSLRRSGDICGVRIGGSWRYDPDDLAALKSR